MARFSRFAALALGAAGVFAGQNCTLTNGTFPAAAWPSSHTRTEMMYQPYLGPIWCRKPIWYDFPTSRYRADVFFDSGDSNPITTLFNFSSYWLGNNLTMITWADPRSLLNSSCVNLDLGFGMMYPDWMQQGTCMGDIWQSQKSAGDDWNYHRVVWTRIVALEEEEGNFDWFSDFSGGGGFQMQAPGQSTLDYVINDEQLLAPAVFTAQDAVFTLPTGPGVPPCVDAGTAKSLSHAGALLEAHGIPASALSALPEVRLGHLLHRRRAAQAAAAAAGAR